MTDDKKDGFSFEKWYAAHGVLLNEERRKRYKTDPGYREKVLAQNRKSRRDKAQERAVERAKEEGAREIALPEHNWKVVDVEVPQGRGTRTIPAVTVGGLAAILGRSIQAVRALEAQGVIPEAQYRSTRGDRLYPEAQVVEIHGTLLAAGRLKDAGRRKGSGTMPYRRTVLWKGRPAGEVALFRVGALALALGRTVVTTEQMEAAGTLPKTPFRGSSTGYRLYTLGMIEAARKAMMQHGPALRGKDVQKLFHDDVEAAWKAEGVFTASLVE